VADSIEGLLTIDARVDAFTVKTHVEATNPHWGFARNARFHVPFDSCHWYGIVTLRADHPFLPATLHPASPSDVARYARLPTPIPALVLGWEGGKLVLHDGAHRLAAARLKGEPTITAYIGVRRV
jgi:hypothetical protein